MANQIHQLISIELVELVDLVELGYLIHDRRSYDILMAIKAYFGNVEMTRVPTDDWDEVEKIVKKVIKS